MNVITVHFSPKCDNIIDGEAYYQRPYPFHVMEDGLIGNQDLWQGKPLKALGFADKLHVQRIDVHWTDAALKPDVAVGKYLITEDENGTVSTHTLAVEKVEVNGLS